MDENPNCRACLSKSRSCSLGAEKVCEIDGVTPKSPRQLTVNQHLQNMSAKSYLQLVVLLEGMWFEVLEVNNEAEYLSCLKCLPSLYATSPLFLLLPIIHLP
ncbi:MAG: hypothetical protein H6577_22510 [Lewinellaceae bacterium]|nr:hypothetical protein [Saprospiraceae bacterium]MCB9340909.1 hypothetical protein [Lewinellaceae bacterium]